MNFLTIKIFVINHIFEFFVGVTVFDLILGTAYLYLLSGSTIFGSEVVEVNPVDYGTTSDVVLSDTEKLQIKVDVSGAVYKPGVISLVSDSVVNDAIVKSGGLKDEACFTFIDKNVNLAKELINGEKLYIPYSSDPECSIEDGVHIDVEESSCISINNASSSQLESLSGVGPSTASKIIEGRPYSNLDDLLDIAGIGSATMEKLNSDICL